ncbi:MAG: M3 family oligoendopeptidase [Candidatus Paracaedibacteraceae bacterium]|nr:M3 family oligoendopeptidase [Candidatus Paracaedibacteraceae bacterium]
MTNAALPSWDLTDFYEGSEDPKIEQDLTTARQLVETFVQSYQFQSTGSPLKNPATLLQSIKDYEVLEDLMGKLMSFAFLNSATQLHNTNAQQFLQHIQEQVTALAAKLVFYNLDIAKLDESILVQGFTDLPDLNRYQSWLNNIRLYKDHQLSEDQEKLVIEKSITGRAAWNRLYDETLAGIKFTWKGEKIGISEIVDKLSDKDESIRAEAAHSMAEGLQSHLSIFTMVTNILAKDKEIDDRWRRYSHPVAARNLANQVEDEVVEALTTAVKGSYANLSHRYYALKAKWLGKDKLEYWDRNAPLPTADDRLIAWGEAKDIVHKAYHHFNPEMAEIGQRFFDNAWIDVPAKPGKRSGAFAHPTVPSVHPYLMLNYQGRLRDVMTLAHELGHGVHQVLASSQGPLLADTPLTIAETASVFGEMLTFQSLLQQCTTNDQKRSMIAAKVEDMLNTVVRQIAFFEFEKQVHIRRRDGELSADELGQIWMQTQREALGDAVKLDECITPYWAYISHFIHAPFYVYAYAFGDCLVNSLYAVYQQGHPGFAEKYLTLLRAGGSKRYPELLAPFGLDAKDPAFWDRGLQMISGMIDQLEEL